MNDLMVSYDREADVLYIARKDLEEETIEISPGFNLELDEKGVVIGVEILEASKVLKGVISQLTQKIRVPVG